MEDRHTLSEPRRNPSAVDGATNSPGWLVDIYRKGVDDPIDTIEISEETLPPRKKKGKVVWRLPSDYSRLVSSADSAIGGLAVFQIYTSYNCILFFISDIHSIAACSPLSFCRCWCHQPSFPVDERRRIMELFKVCWIGA